MKIIYTPQHALVKNEVKDYFLPGSGLWWDGVGVAQDFVIVIHELGTYKLTIPARLGDKGNQKAFHGAYEVFMNGQPLIMTWDEASIVKVDTIFDGAWMANLSANVTYTQPNNKLTIKSKLRWIGIGPIDDGQPEVDGGYTELQVQSIVAERLKLATAGMFTQAQVDTMIKSNTDTLKAGIAAIVSDAKATEAATWKAKIEQLRPAKTVIDSLLI